MELRIRFQAFDLPDELIILRPSSAKFTFQALNFRISAFHGRYETRLRTLQQSTNENKYISTENSSQKELKNNLKTVKLTSQQLETGEQVP